MEVLITILSLSVPVLLLSWLLPEKLQMLPVSVCTALFLLYVSPVSLAVLVFTTISSFYIVKQFNSKPIAIVLVIIEVFCIFIYFKIQEQTAFNSFNNSVLPLGLSYYSFKQIHYIIEAYKKKLPKHSLFDYTNYLFFLPTILIGPINRFPEFLKDFKKRRWNNEMFSEGLERILYGLVKIIVLGNYLFSYKLNNYTISIAEDHEWLSAYLQIIKFAANAYVQFAGFSDVAIGLALLFGFKINENFNFPFIAQNIADFWKRWHMSLSEWCKDYVFIPFLSITRNALFSIIMTMLILGVWHEVSFRYILWGFLHAVVINLWHRFEKSKFRNSMSRYPIIQKYSGILFTAHFVMFSFVIVSENSLNESIDLLKIIFLLNT